MFIRAFFTKFSLWKPRKKLIFFGLVAFAFFVLNIVLILHCLDVSIHKDFYLSLSRKENSQEYAEPFGCPAFSANDSLGVSAFNRMQTNECRSKLKEFLCSLSSDTGWPVHQTENTCSAYFDASKRYGYMGCFKDLPSSRLLDGFKYDFVSDNSAEKCVQTCLRAGFLYAGVEYGIECFCGSSIEEGRKQKLKDEQCRTYPCPNSNSLSCGGFKTIAIYSTGVKENKKAMPKFVDLPQQVQKGKEANLNSVRILFVLQLNGRNSRQVQRLVKMIYRPNHLYYVHVDTRQKYMFNEMSKIQEVLESAGVKNFYVTPHRLSTIWGGSSLLEMFLGVIRWSLKHSSAHWANWDYVLNLSEADMPLLSMDELEYNLFSNMGMNFLSSHGYNTANFLKKQGFNFYFMECEQRMWRIGAKRDYPQNLRLDGGSDWVVVHRDLAEFSVSDSLELPKQIRRLFTTILLPLEGFFHTLALNSNFCTKVLYKNLRLTNWKRKQGCRCGMLKKIVDWCGCSPLAIRDGEDRFDVQDEIGLGKRSR